MSEINTKTMNREELEAAATDLDLQFPHNISDGKLRVKIDEALGDTSASKGDATGATDMTDESTPEKRFEIIIATHDQDKQPVPVGVNGKIWLIQRGKKVIVPASVIGVLNTATQYQYDPQTMERSEVQSYPFQIVREV